MTEKDLKPYIIVYNFISGLSPKTQKGNEVVEDIKEMIIDLIGDEDGVLDSNGTVEEKVEMLMKDAA